MKLIHILSSTVDSVMRLFVEQPIEFAFVSWCNEPGHGGLVYSHAPAVEANSGVLKQSQELTKCKWVSD